MAADHVDVPVGQGDGPFAVAFRQGEDEVLAEFLDLPPYLDGLLAVEVEVFLGEAEQLAFAHAEGRGQFGDGPQFGGVRGGQGEDDSVVPDFDVRRRVGGDLDDGRVGEVLPDGPSAMAKAKAPCKTRYAPMTVEGPNRSDRSLIQRWMREGLIPRTSRCAKTGSTCSR
jgi:hypothetical protein